MCVCLCVYLQGAAERLDRTNRDSARPLKIYHDDTRVTSLPAIGGRGFLCANQDFGRDSFISYVSFVRIPLLETLSEGRIFKLV